MKKIIFALSLGLILTMVLSIYTGNVQSEIAQNVLRLHVLANSDSEEDQALKLKVRDRLLSESRALFQNANSPAETKAIFLDNREMLTAAAEETIAAEGYPYPVSLSLSHTYFPSRHYGNVALPAGEYDAVRVEIGAAEGQNWWCVMFPPLCFVDGSIENKGMESVERLRESLGPDADIITPDGDIDVTLRFKLVDIFQTTTHAIKEAFKKA